MQSVISRPEVQALMISAQSAPTSDSDSKESPSKDLDKDESSFKIEDEDDLTYDGVKGDGDNYIEY